MTVVLGWGATAYAFAGVTVEPNGDWPGYAGEYFAGQASGDDPSSEIGVCYSHDGSESVTEAGWDEVAPDGTVVGGESWPASGADADCLNSSIAWADLTEGAHTYRVWARGTSSGVVYSDPWTVYVDRTPPGWTFAPDFNAEYDSATNTTTVDWNPAFDPALSDGTPGSGLWAGGEYGYRYRRNGGAWTTWMGANDSEFTLASSFSGEAIDVEVRVADAVGNLSATISASLTAGTSVATVDNIGTASPDESGDEDMQPEPVDLYDFEGNLPDDAGGGGEAARAADGYTETLCPGGGPCGTYDGEAAARYARKWDDPKYASAQRRNPDYNYYEDDDCTNFASQALKAGGFRFMRAHGHNDPDARDDAVRDLFLTGEGSWWSYYTDAEVTDPVTGGLRYHATTSFVRSETLFEHLIGYDLAEVVGPGGKVRPGDLVFYDLWTGVSGFDHTQIVSRVSHGTIYVSQHTPHYYHSLAWSRQHWKDKHGEYPRYIIVHPLHTAANITG